MNSGRKRTVAGGLCGLTECMMVQPLDMLTVRYQLHSGRNPSLMHAIRDVYQEGGIMRFYRGCTPELCSMVPKNVAMYASYDFARQWLEDRLGRRGMDVEFLSGLVCSVPEAMTVTPFHVVKVRLQSKEHLSRYRNPGHALATIVRQEGPAALTMGLFATTARNSVFNCIYFPTMFWMRNHVLPVTNADTLAHNLKTLGAGCFAGGFATCFNLPFDVAKSRVQKQTRGQNAQSTALMPTILTIARQEGPQALYKGFVPKVLRMGIGSGVAMATFELVYNLLSTA